NQLGQVQSLAYANLRLTAFDHLHLDAAVHWSRYENKYAYDSLCTSITSSCHRIGDVSGSTAQNYSQEDISWPPSLSLSYDFFGDSLTAYVGYTDIYQNQGSVLTADLKSIGPITGENLEAGLKWQVGGMNATLAAYRIKQRGFAMLD